MICLAFILDSYHLSASLGVSKQTHKMRGKNVSILSENVFFKISCLMNVKPPSHLHHKVLDPPTIFSHQDWGGTKDSDWFRRRFSGLLLVRMAHGTLPWIYFCYVCRLQPKNISKNDVSVFWINIGVAYLIIKAA